MVANTYPPPGKRTALEEKRAKAAQIENEEYDAGEETIKILANQTYRRRTTPDPKTGEVPKENLGPTVIKMKFDFNLGTGILILLLLILVCYYCTWIIMKSMQ